MYTEPDSPQPGRPDQILIRTKLERPRVRPGYVDRARLLARLDEALDHRLTLISAPPGFGKTTLVVQWLTRQPHPCAWLSIDPFDHDVEGFLRYLVAAVEGASTHRLPETAALLATRERVPLDHQLQVVAGEMARLDRPLVLVLEDFHAAGQQEVAQVVERFVATMPEALHLVVITRRDPPWPLARWDAEGWLLQLRERDLRFSHAEARSFFKADRPVLLSDPIADLLRERAEGWIAGLRLVKISLAEAKDPEQRARQFSGSDRLIADYLIEQVLAVQPEPVREFLAATATLPRFTASLCDYVLGAGASGLNSRERLAQFDRDNLFLVPLGTDGHWYRYHHLFRDLLLDHLPELSTPEHRARVARRAGEWFAREGWVEEALRQWVGAGELDAAADLVGENLQAVLDKDMTRQVLVRWLETFPPGAERGRLPLLVAHGYIAVTIRDLPSLAELLAEADGLSGGRTSSATCEPGRFGADLAAQRAFLYYWLGEPKQALDSASQALRLLPPRRGGMARLLATLYQAGALHTTGRMSDGVALLEQAAANGLGIEKGRAAFHLMGAAWLHLYAAELDAARTCANRVLAVHETVPVPDYALGPAIHQLGVVAYERNDLETAAAEFGRLEAMRYCLPSAVYHDTLIGLALIAQVRGDSDAAARHASDARAYILERKDPTSLITHNSFEIRLALQAGEVNAKPSPPPTRDVMSPWLEVPSITYAEILLRHPSAETRAGALPFIDEALARAEAFHNVRQAISFSILRAEALAEQGLTEQALDALAETVRRAEPSGLVRRFLDRGPRTVQLLEELAERQGRGGYLGNLLLAANQAAAPGSAAKPHLIRGELSRREQEVLDLLARRLSRKEIAARLGVSSETVKSHTRTLYQKLGARSREEAVARAVTAGVIRRPS